MGQGGEPFLFRLLMLHLVARQGVRMLLFLKTNTSCRSFSGYCMSMSLTNCLMFCKADWSPPIASSESLSVSWVEPIGVMTRKERSGCGVCTERQAFVGPPRFLQKYLAQFSASNLHKDPTEHSQGSHSELIGGTRLIDDAWLWFLMQRTDQHLHITARPFKALDLLASDSL